MPVYSKHAEVKVATGGCRCKEEPEPKSPCCELDCFDRPQYHCGHLLTSDDLCLQLRYDVEKNKLRNRSLHGAGVVCGLRLTCDPACDGSIRIATGYAIDECGNDLVVCEETRFPVMLRLREKKLIGPTKHTEPEKKPLSATYDGVTETVEVVEVDEECPERHCFYIVACYHEEKCEYETPIASGCEPKPRDCLPTRIQEGVKFDVLPKPPKHKGVLDDLQHIPACVTALEEGPVGKMLQEAAGKIEAIVNGQGNRPAEAPDPNCDLFCKLKKLFRQHVREYPAQYTCDFVHEIGELTCPDSKDKDYGTKLKDAYCQLLDLLWRYAVECVVGEMVFDCPEPECPSCIPLGAVYVENGRLVRVCNTPRWYVWSFASFWKVLFFSIMDAGIRERTRSLEKKSCCPEFPVDYEILAKRLGRRKSLSNAVSAFPSALMAAIKAVAANFDFFSSESVPPQDYMMNVEEIKKLNLNIRATETIDTTAEQELQRNVFAAFMSQALIRDRDSVVVLKTPGTDKARVMREFTDVLTMARTAKVREAKPGEQPKAGTPKGRKADRNE